MATVYIDDDEAFDLWKKIAGLPESRIVRIAGSDNFWSMGDTGPCGPCSEIFYDHGDTIPGGPPGSPDQDGDRWVEIWNLVFMQFDQAADGSRTSLPKPSIDTGMGLERTAAVMQGVHSNYDIDLFKTLIAASVELTGVKAEGEHAPSHRVIADHLRASSFLIADGVTPSNEGRGYVLRRIMRRAMRHAHLLGANEPLMYRLVPPLTAEMGQAYPELKRGEHAIADTLRQEEERFRTTLGRGMSLFDEASAGLGAGDMFSGDTAFKLYDTYGFPLDLTQDEARRRGFGVDVEGFEAAMAQQRTRGRENWKGSGQKDQAGVWLALRERHGATRFIGYEHVDGAGATLAIVADGNTVDSAEAGETVDVLFDVTPFYAESGGQAGDTGEVEWSGGKARVLDTQKQAGDLSVHRLQIVAGKLSVSDRVQLRVDAERRTRTRANHSATHLLHAALRNVLGPHVTQKGQMVDGERIRFDFSHGAPVSPQALDSIEAEVNAVIRQNVPAETKLMAPQAAMEAGAMALFGEKYGDEVRVLTLGRALAAKDASGEGAYSVELCGGTHVARTGDIALFKIVSEGGIAAGVRRIEALTGEDARRYLLDQAQVAKTIADQFKVQVADAPARVDALVAERRALDKQLSDAKRQLALGGGSGGPTEAEEIGGVKFMGRVLDGVGGKELRPVAEDFRKQIGSGVVALVGVSEGKAAVTVAVTADLTARINAADLARAAVIAMGGQGAGGKPDFAQGGAPDATKAAEGIAAVRAALAG